MDLDGDGKIDPQSFAKKFWVTAKSWIIYDSYNMSHKLYKIYMMSHN